MQKINILEKELYLASIDVKRNESLIPHTTMKVGGNADLFAVTHNIQQLETAVNSSLKLDVPFLVVGNGSNIIVSDSGYKGFVILNNTHDYKILRDSKSVEKNRCMDSRFKPLDNDYLSVSAFQYSDEGRDDVVICADSGLKINVLMTKLFKKGITGLEWFSGIPATVGGAIYMNIHGGCHYFGDIVEKTLLTYGVSKEVEHDYFRFGYDWSILHQTGEIVLQANLRLKKGDVQKAKKLANRWLIKKSQQPQRSAGCIFHNLTKAEQVHLNLPTPSIGYLIDNVLNLKGVRCGGAIISEKHAAFIENQNNASANDIIQLINLVKEKAKNQLGLNLKTEVKLIGNF